MMLHFIPITCDYPTSFEALKIIAPECGNAFTVEFLVLFLRRRLLQLPNWTLLLVLTGLLSVCVNLSRADIILNVEDINNITRFCRQ